MNPENILKSPYVSWKIEGVRDNVSKGLFHFYCHVKLKVVRGWQTQAVTQENLIFLKPCQTPDTCKRTGLWINWATNMAHHVSRM